MEEITILDILKNNLTITAILKKSFIKKFNIEIPIEKPVVIDVNSIEFNKSTGKIIGISGYKMNDRCSTTDYYYCKKYEDIEFVEYTLN